MAAADDFLTRLLAGPLPDAPPPAAPVPVRVRDVPIPEAPADAGDFVNYGRVLDRRRRERAQRARQMTAPVADPEERPWTDLQSRCFMCSQGVRSVDAGTDGTGRFVELTRIVGRLWSLRSPGWMTALVLRFFDKWMRPLFERAHVPAPELEAVALYEHFSTTRHTKHVRVMQITQINDITDEIEDFRSSMRTREGVTDTRVAACVDKKRKDIRDIYLMDTSKCAFRDDGIDGDMEPDVSTFMSPAAAVLDLRPHLAPPVFAWLCNEVATADTAEPPPVAAAAPPPHPADAWRS